MFHDRCVVYVCLKKLIFKQIYFRPNLILFNALSVYLPVGVSGQNEIGYLTCSAVRYWELLLFPYLYSYFDLKPELLYIHTCASFLFVRMYSSIMLYLKKCNMT